MPSTLGEEALVIGVIAQPLNKGTDGVELIRHMFFHRGPEELIGLVIKHGDAHHIPHEIRLEGSFM